MRAVVIHRSGGYERLRIEEHADRAPGPLEVAVACEAAGVNYADCIVRMGLYSSAKEYVGWPITPGFEFAGTVEAIGDGVEGIAPGDPVFGVTRFGGYASRVVVPAGQVFPRPAELTPTEAAAFPAVSLTAWYALHVLACPRAGGSVLVHSAAGGVGGTLCQLGRAAGLRVVGVVGAPHKVDEARRLGATDVVDKSSADLWAEVERLEPNGFDAVFDANGVATLKKSYEHLGPEGRLVSYGFHSMMPRRGGRPRWLRLALDYVRTPRFNPIELTQKNRSVLGFNLSYLFHRSELLADALGTLSTMRQRGELVAPSIETFPLEDVAEAHRKLESGSTVGKLVLLPGGACGPG